MKHLHCAICKFTLPVNDSKEADAYKANHPMHCGQPMLVDGQTKEPVTTPAETPVAKEEAKEEKKGLFGLGGKKKKK